MHCPYSAFCSWHREQQPSRLDSLVATPRKAMHEQRPWRNETTSGEKCAARESSALDPLEGACSLPIRLASGGCKPQKSKISACAMATATQEGSLLGERPTFANGVNPLAVTTFATFLHRFHVTLQRKSGPLRFATLNAPVEQVANRKQRTPAHKNGINTATKNK